MKKHLPNILTGSRIVIIPLFVAGFYVNGIWGYWITAALFAYASVTDFFDGYMARAWEADSKLGRFMDPIADKLLVAAAILMLVHDERAAILPSLAILMREILVSGLREFLAGINVSVPVSRLAKIKTAAQMFSIFLLLLAPGLPLLGISEVSTHSLEVLGNSLLWMAAVLTLVTGYAYLRTGLKHM